MIKRIVKYAIIVMAIIATSLLSYCCIIHNKQNIKCYRSKRNNSVTNISHLNHSTIIRNNKKYISDMSREYPDANKLAEIVNNADIHEWDVEIIYENAFSSEYINYYLGKYIIVRNNSCKYNIVFKDSIKNHATFDRGMTDEECGELQYLSTTILKNAGNMIAAKEKGWLKHDYNTIMIRSDKKEITYKYDGDYTLNSIMNVCDKQLFGKCKTNILLYTIIEQLRYTGCSMCYKKDEEWTH